MSKEPAVKKVFVGCLISTITEDQLKECFRYYHGIESIKIVRNAKDNACKGYAFINVRGQENLDKILQDAIYFQGRRLDISQAHSADSKAVSLQKQTESKIHVKNLHKSVDDRQLMDFYVKFGPVVKAYVIYDPNNGKSKKFGYVQFENKSSVDLVLNAKQLWFKSKALIVSRFIPKALNSNQNVKKTSEFNSQMKNYCNCYDSGSTTKEQPNNSVLTPPKSISIQNVDTSTYDNSFIKNPELLSNIGSRLNQEILKQRLILNSALQGYTTSLTQMNQLKAYLIQNYSNVNSLVRKNEDYSDKIANQKLSFDECEIIKDELFDKDDILVSENNEISDFESLDSPIKIESMKGLILTEQTVDMADQNTDLPSLRLHQNSSSDFSKGSIPDMDDMDAKNVFRFEKSIPKIFVHDQM